MLTAEGCAIRRARLRAALTPHCDALVIADPAHLIYLADLVPSPFEFRSNEWSAALVLGPETATLVADDMLGPSLAQAHVEEIVAPTWYDGDHSAPYRRGLVVRRTLEVLAKLPGRRIGVELAAVPAGVVEGLRATRSDVELIDVGPFLRNLRRVKDADELALLNRSMRAGEAAQAAALAHARPGMTELDVSQLVQAEAQTELGERAIIYGDFVSGPRTWKDKGGAPSTRVIESGDLLLLDFSVVVGGYRGDFTNTFAVGGPPTPRQRELYDACLEALAAGEATLKAGIPAKDVDAAVRGEFARRGLAEAFVHHTGHGIGLGHPEPPYFTPNSSEILKAGDVVTLEPGLYVDNEGGIRIERNYLVIESGAEILSRHALKIDQAG